MYSRYYLTGNKINVGVEYALWRFLVSTLGVGGVEGVLLLLESSAAIYMHYLGLFSTVTVLFLYR